MPSLQWSTPVRCDGSRSLAPIPTEIYLAIFTYARTIPFPKRQLQNLSLVCHLFYAIIIPWIFKEFTITTRGSDTNSSLHHSSLSQAIRSEDKNALVVVTYVNRCTFEDWKDYSNAKLRWCFVELLALHSTSLRSMSNLTELSLLSTLITRNLLKAMATHSHLESLKLDCCELDGDILRKHLSHLSFPKLKLLHFTHLPLEISQDDSRPVEMLFGYLNLNFLEDISSSNDRLLHQLVVLEGNLPLLKAAFTRIRNYDNLVNLIAKAPGLQSLHISSVDNDQPLLQLDTRLLPKLQSLKFPISGFNALIGMGNVQEVIIDDWTTLQEFQSLQKLRCSYTSMCVPAQIYLGIPFWDHFPQLVILEITFGTYSAGPYATRLRPCIEDIVSKWPKHPATLRTLHLNLIIHQSTKLTSPSYLLRQYRWVVDIIFPRIPTLRQCSFDQYHTWFYGEEDEKWKVEINPGKEQDLNRTSETGFLSWPSPTTDSD